MMTEIRKLFKSGTILYLLIIMIIISLSFSLFGLNGISSELALSDKQMIASEYNFDLIYYCMPIFIVFLADFIFSNDIKMGTMRYLIIKSDRRKIYFYKIIGLFTVTVILNIFFNLTNSLFIKYELGIWVAGEFLRAALCESVPIIEMSLVFALVSILSKKNNFVYLISIHFIFIFLTESSLLLGKYTYINDFKKAILDGSLSILGFAKIIVLILITYQIFNHKEL